MASCNVARAAGADSLGSNSLRNAGAPRQDEPECAVPDEFLCPITREPMVYPYMTTEGNTFEWSALVEWLASHARDPLTNVELQDKRVFPNNALRQQLRAWFARHPEVSPRPRADVPRPPVPARGDTPAGTSGDDAALGRILRYTGSADREKVQAQAAAAVPAQLRAHGHTYTFSRDATGATEEGQRPLLLVSCDGNAPVVAPEPAMFVTRQGIVFYDPTEMRDTRVLPGTDRADACRFGARCSRNGCYYSHPFVCPFGVACRSLKAGSAACKFLHPSAESVRAEGKSCKYGTSCSNESCKFAHPRGRMAVSRTPARVLVTHSLGLDELAEPQALQLQAPASATQFQFQGEFALFFTPHPGTWAKEHFASVAVHRYDQRAHCHRAVRDFSLDGHYCNSAVAAGRYIVLSFWPYEEEAVRTIWDCLRVTRLLEKELGAKERTIKQLRAKVDADAETIASLKQSVAKLRGQLKDAHAQAARARQDARAARKAYATANRALYQKRQELRAERDNRRAAQAQVRAMRRTQERQRNERLRLRDPIHVFAQQDGTSGLEGGHWHHVLDYHKGAHDLSLSEPGVGGEQHLVVTEHDVAFHFDLVVPSDVASMGQALPMVPGRLCEDF